MNTTTDLLWTPPQSRVEQSNLSAFMHTVSAQTNQQFDGYHSLYHWSVTEPETFWQLFLREADVIYSGDDQQVLENADRMIDARWFPGVQLNYAENLLKRSDDHDALVFQGEDQVRRVLSFAELHREVAATAQALRELGVVKGDRVAGFLPNMPEAIIAMLATASIGAVWSSSSPDFGVKGVLDRFGQIEPVVLFTADAYYYNGKSHDSLSLVREFSAQLPSLKKIVVVPYVNPDISAPADMPLAETYPDFTAGKTAPLTFEPVPFDHPLFIMFSSGTTGVPKCIVHSAGGTLLQHLKEHRLHIDLKPDDRFFYFTTCGWMMWNWLVTGLATGATLLLYDGSPFYPDGNALFDFAAREHMTILGTSAKFLDAANKAGIEPVRTHQLPQLQSILSTGSTLAPESFDYVYRAIKPDVWLASMSGGTDMIGCFISGSPTLPVYRGQLQCRALALKVEVYNDEGQAVEGEKGELVCTAAFPSQPTGFWNDPEKKRYHDAYFARFDNVWCHGDYVELTPEQGVVIYGRSDAVLNPGGVRIGTAEIYRQVEQLDEVVEGLVVGQEWDNDVRVVLFVRLRDGLTLDDSLRDRIRQQVRTNTTARHVPAVVLQVVDIPRTKSGKIVELAVRNIIHGRPVRNRDALANPEALDAFLDLPELR
ncbi:MAG: acetoacetate--CoA ligase [Gammaproteobacteria bacterium]|nr:acetoacetate--CoA ligase [Gammaproteobacteria bacterium]